MAQKYASKTARERMAKGLCPECGQKVSEHTGWGSPGCGLTDSGAAERIAQFQDDEKEKK